MRSTKPALRSLSALQTKRNRFIRALWDERGRRRLPPDKELRGAISALPSEEVWNLCETSPFGPVYLLPTREWLRALARYIDSLKVRRVLEVAAGDGFLSQCLAKARPQLKVVATDDHSWTKPAGRMTAVEQRRHSAVGKIQGIRPAAHVSKMSVTKAVAQHRPDLVIVAWPPPGRLVERAIKGPCRYVLDLSVDGDVCGDNIRTWKYEKEFLDGPLVERALCRLDGKPLQFPATTATLYYGARHPLFGRG